MHHLYILVLVFLIKKVETQRHLRSTLGKKKFLEHDFPHFLQVSLPLILAAHIYQVLAKEFNLVFIDKILFQHLNFLSLLFILN